MRSAACATLPVVPGPLSTTFRSPLGELLLVGDGEALGGLFLPRHRHEPASARGLVRRPEAFGDAVRQLEEYFAGERVAFELPLVERGTPFQQEVWRELRAIPYGETISYGELARRLGRPAAVRAVGAANGRNPISIVTPCHRVIGSGGALTGYGGGMAAKRFLLDLEATQRPLGTTGPFAPLAGAGR